MAGAKLIDVTAEGRPRIDRYELVAEIASGGMATVFLARLSGMGGFQRFVAIKRLHPHLQSEQEFVQMFLDEARLSAGIHHPNVVPIIEVGASEKGYYLVMEYIEGDTLARLLARGASVGQPLPVDIGLRVIFDMLGGLHAAHELRDDEGNPTELVHRDVSPQNILVGVNGISRITDFGVARAASRLGATRAGQLKGKIAYMAPEHAAGEALDRRADVFSAGIVLWEVLAGRRLFKAANEAATISRILNERIASPAQFNPALSGEIVAVCMKALARDRDRRFATAASFADALERAAAASETTHVATPKQTAAYVTEAIGSEIEQQRQAVRAWLARSEASFRQPQAGTSLTAASMSLPQPDDEATVSYGGRSRASIYPEQRSRRPLIVVAAGIVAAIGLIAAILTRGGDEPSVVVPPGGGELRPIGQPPAIETPTAEPADAGAGSEESDAGASTADASAQPVATQAPPSVGRPLPGAPRPAPTKPRPRPRPDPVEISNPYR